MEIAEEDRMPWDGEEPAAPPAERMLRLFLGYDQAYGTYDGTRANEEKGGKLEIKSTASTRRGVVSTELWQRHLDGLQPLGVIPIRANNTCFWGVIDIDQYGIDAVEVMGLIEREKFPLVPCRSKSGGMHLFLFFEDPVPASMIIARLREMAALLGHGSAEVFPKQSTVDLERGDLGSWLNMPYFNAAATDRFGYDRDGGPLVLSEFLRRAEAAKQPRSFVEIEQRRRSKKQDPEFGDGPPCLQHLASSGFSEGSRNKGLFNLATFAKKKFSTRWQEMVEKWNREYFNPPLPASEVLSIMSSQEKKEYNYTCKDQPLCSHCNSDLCRTRRFGVGGEDDVPVISALSVLMTEPPVWFVNIDGVRLELSSEDLQNYKTFHRICMERLLRCYQMLKQSTWFDMVRVAMNDVQRIEAPPEGGTTGKFNELLEQFLTNRHRGEVKEDLILGRPWLDTETNRYYFRLGDLEKFLVSSGFKDYRRNTIVARIRDMGGGKQFFNFKGQGVNAQWVPSMWGPVTTSTLPPIKSDPI